MPTSVSALAKVGLRSPFGGAAGEPADLRIVRITPTGMDVPAGRQIVFQFDRAVDQDGSVRSQRKGNGGLLLFRLFLAPLRLQSQNTIFQREVDILFLHARNIGLDHVVIVLGLDIDLRGKE